MKILYIHTTAAFSGAAKSLLENIKPLINNNSIKPVFLLPKGNVVDKFINFTNDVFTVRGISQFNHTEYGFYRGFRWIIILRELFFIIPTINALIKINKKHSDIDLIHVNEITGLPTAILARLILKKRVIIHVRALCRSKESLRLKILNKLLKKYTVLLLSIDETVKNSLDNDLNIKVIHNSFTNNDAIVDFEDKSTKNNELRLGYVGNLLESKGIFELIESLNILKKSGSNIKLFIAGANHRKYKSFHEKILIKFGILRDAQSEIDRYIKYNDLDENIVFLGFISNLSDVYNKIDVLCFPSHLNAPGRPIFEAASFHKPSILAIDDPKNDTFINKETGLVIKGKNVDSLVNAIMYFYENPEEIERMGKNAYALYKKNFDPSLNSLKLFEIYRSLL